MRGLGGYGMTENVGHEKYASALRSIVIRYRGGYAVFGHKPEAAVGRQGRARQFGVSMRIGRLNCRETSGVVVSYVAVKSRVKEEYGSDIAALEPLLYGLIVDFNVYPWQLGNERVAGHIELIVGLLVGREINLLSTCKGRETATHQTE